jgi:hypothetical protein
MRGEFEEGGDKIITDTKMITHILGGETDGGLQY